MDQKMMSKGGQVAIFVIIAIVIVAGLGLYFLFRGNPAIQVTGSEFDPQQFIGSCIRDSVDRHSVELLARSGVPDSRDNVRYGEQELAYLCKNINYYEPCINQYPLLLTHMQEVMKQDVESDVSGCFGALKAEAEKRNFDVIQGVVESELTLQPDSVVVTIKAPLDISKGDVNQHFDVFTVRVKNAVHNLGSVASEIVRQEAQYCYFETLGYSLLYNRYEVTRDVLSDSTKIYTILDTEGGQSMKFAVRGCAIPAGL